MPDIPWKYRIRALAGAPLRRAAFRARRTFLHQARHDARGCQQRVLQRLLSLNADSCFSRDHRLRPGMSLAEFRDAVPVADYGIVQPYVDRMQHGDHRALLGSRNRLLMYAVTSGTTGRSKLIPITREFVRCYRRGWQIWGIGAYGLHTILQHLNIMQITSSHRRFTAPDGTPCGNISGLVASTQTRAVRSLYTVSPEVALIPDSEARRYTTLRLALTDPHIGMMITANPGTLTQLLQVMQEHAAPLIRDIFDGGVSPYPLPANLARMLRRSLKAAPERARQLDRILERCEHLPPADCWPHLRLLGVWSGGSVGAYLPHLRRQFPQAVVRDHGLHASEGRMTVPLDDGTSSGLLEIDTHFFEFLPVADADAVRPDVLQAHELREGGEYFILLTTCSGLYRYNIRDVVRCTGFFGQTPLLEFRHKGAHISSITGEKIAESQVVEAVQAAATCLDIGVPTFTMTPFWDDPPGYSLYVNPGGSEAAAGEFLLRLAESVDGELRRRNVEYDEKRSSGRLAPVHATALPADVWDRLTQHRTQSGGGSPEQYKHPCLLPDPRFEDLFLKECGLASPAEAS